MGAQWTSPDTGSMGFTKGVIESFNPLTLANTVRVGAQLVADGAGGTALVGGEPLTDLPFFGLAEAASLTVGDVVSIIKVGSTWAILGRFVFPNTPEAASALSFLSTRIYADQADGSATTSSASFGDGSGGTEPTGPSVTPLVGPSGSIIVMFSAQVQGVLDVTQFAAEATIEMSGANTLSADDASLVFRPRVEWGETFTGSFFVSTNPTAIKRFDGLTAGLTTITAKYRRQSGAVTADFFRRSLVVVAL